MRRKWIYSKEELQSVVLESKSIAEVCRKLNCPNNIPIKQQIAEFNIDTSHFTGAGWNKNSFNYDRFQYGRVISSSNALAALAYKRGRQCEKCKMTTWLDELIPLEIHHLDGDKLNNEESNLKILCPNCHALTENYCGKNLKKSYVPEDIFVTALKQNKNIRQALLSLGLTAKGANYTRARELIFKYKIEHLLEL